MVGGDHLVAGQSREARPVSRDQHAARASGEPDGRGGPPSRRRGKAFVDISGGLHASEIAGSQHTPLIAYDLLSKANDPKIKTILDNDILFLWPSINP